MVLEFVTLFDEIADYGGVLAQFCLQILAISYQIIDSFLVVL